MEDVLIVDESKYLELADQYPSSYDESGNPIENDQRDKAIVSYFSKY